MSTLYNGLHNKCGLYVFPSFIGLEFGIYRLFTVPNLKCIHAVFAMLWPFQKMLVRRCSTGWSVAELFLVGVYQDNKLFEYLNMYQGKCSVQSRENVRRLAWYSILLQDKMVAVVCSCSEFYLNREKQKPDIRLPRVIPQWAVGSLFWVCWRITQSSIAIYILTWDILGKHDTVWGTAGVLLHPIRWNKESNRWCLEFGICCYMATGLIIHWSGDKMAPVLQTTQSNTLLLEWKL